MPEKLAIHRIHGPTDVQGNCHCGAGGAKAAVQQVQAGRRRWLPWFWLVSRINLPHEAVRESRVKVSQGETGLWSLTTPF
jgi:hypothetical protein